MTLASIAALSLVAGCASTQTVMNKSVGYKYQLYGVRKDKCASFSSVFRF